MRQEPANFTGATQTAHAYQIRADSAMKRRGLFYEHESAGHASVMSMGSIHIEEKPDRRNGSKKFVGNMSSSIAKAAINNIVG